MINYNSINLIKYDGYRSILEFLHLDIPTDQQVWEVARQHEEIPLLENILLDLVLSEIHDHLTYHFSDLEISYYINAADTHLHVNGEMVMNYEDLKEQLIEYAKS